MINEPTTVVKLRGLPWGMAANISNLFFVYFTFFGPVFILFLWDLEFSVAKIGFVLSLIPFSNVIAPLCVPSISRFGYKRIFLIFYALRNMAPIGLLATPWIMAQFGLETLNIFIPGVVGIFGIFHVVAETAYYQWNQEFVPVSVRSKYTTTNNAFMVAASISALVAAFYIYSRNGTTKGFMTLNGYMTLFASGLFFGLISIGCSAFIPSEASKPDMIMEAKGIRSLSGAMHDRNFMLFLVYIGIVTLYAVPICSFGLFYMVATIGLLQGSILYLSIATFIGTLVMSYMWSWISARYSSKRVITTGICLRILILFALWNLPRQASLSLFAALGISFIQGFVDMGWGFGSTRIHYISDVSSAKNLDYTALYLAWIGILGGISLLASGQILETLSGFSGQLGLVPVDTFSPLFLAGIALMFLSLALVHYVHADAKSNIGQFAGIFLRGNPFGTGSVEFEDLKMKKIL